MQKIKLIGEIDSWGYARYCLEYALSQVPEGEPVELEVDSLGGDVMEAITISNMLRERGNVTAHIVGFCASAATWLCYGADKVIINEDCAYLIHKCSSHIDAWGSMNADEIDALIEKLKSEKKSNEAIDLIIARKYANHSGGKLDIKAALKLMKEERWMLPDEALSLGLVDEISADHVLAKTNMAARLHVMNKINLPPLPSSMSEAFAAKVQEQEDGLVAKVKKALTEFFGGAVANLAPITTDALETAEEVEPKITNMITDFKNVNTLLGVENIEETGGKVTLDLDAIKRIDEQLAEMDNLRTERTTLATEKSTAETALANAIAAIDGISEDIATLDTIEDKVSAIKHLLDLVTAFGTETHSQGEGNGHEVSSDPVNRLVQIYRK